MSDLFDRVAAKTLGLGVALRPRARSRFEPGPEPVGIELPGLEPVESIPPGAEPIMARTAPLAAAPVAEDPVTRQVRAAPVAGVVAPVGRRPERDVVPAPSATQPAASVEAPAKTDLQDASPMIQLSQRSILPPSELPAAAAEMMREAHPVTSRPADDPLPLGHGRDGSHVPRDVPLISPVEQATRAVVSPDAPRARPAERKAKASQVSATNLLPHPLAPPTAHSADTVPIAALPPDAPPLRLATLAKQRAPIVAARSEPPGRASLPEQQAPGQAAESLRAPRRQGRQAEARPETAAPPTIEITIGRLEIRAEPVAAPRPAKPFQPHLDLAAYRAKREHSR